MKWTFKFILGLGLLSSIICPLFAETPGSLDVSFDPNTAYSDVFYGLAIQADGKILASGRQGSAGSPPILGVIYRLDANNGIKDPSFQSGPRASCLDSTIPQINAIVLQTDSPRNILLGGQFTSFDSPVRLRLARLSFSGSIDQSFSLGANNSVYAILTQPDGKILIGGSFTDFAGTGHNYVTRLNADGTPDQSFVAGNSPGAAVRALALQADGKILIGGDFTTVNSHAALHIARLEPNGVFDTTFDSTNGPDGSVYTIAVQPFDQKAVIGGYFLNVNGVSHARIARLETNGPVDPTFNASCDSYVWALAIQSNNKILAGGRFNNVGGARKIARFLADGTVDPSFDSAAGAGTGTSDEVRAIQIQPDGKVVVAGKFTTFNNQTRYGIARLHGGESAPAVLPPTASVIRPTNQIVLPGSRVTFTATTEGTPPFLYKWYCNSTLIDGATSDSLPIVNVQGNESGSYFVIISNSGGTNQTASANLQVVPFKATHMNISSDGVLITLP